MILDKRITRLDPSFFRFNLTLRDVKDPHPDQIINVESGDGIIEDAYLFVGNPIVYPHMVYKDYAMDLEDLRRIIGNYLFLNPSINFKGLRYLSEFVYKNHIYQDNDLFTLDDVKEEATLLHESYPFGEFPILQNNKHILYKYNSILTADDKRKYTNYARSGYMAELYGKLIHEALLYTIDNIPRPILFTKKTVMLNTSKVKSSDKEIKSLKTYNKHEGDINKFLLEFEMQRRNVQPCHLPNFRIYTSLDSSLSLRKKASLCKVCVNTIRSWNDFSTS